MNETTITTGKVRLSYAHLFTPTTAPGSDVAKYSVSVIIDKNDKATIDKLNAAIEKAKQVGIATKWGGKLPKNLHLPLRDGDAERDDAAYENAFFFNCSSTRQPSVVDRSLNLILDPSEVYSGCYARVNVNLYPYDSNGNRGIAVGLNSVQKVADGEMLGGGAPKVEDAFADDFDDDLLD